MYLPLEARIIQACDAFHAMATDRPYRRALQRPAVLAELRAQSGKQFDPRVVDALISVIETEEVKLEAASAAGTTPVPAPPVIGPRAWERHLEAVEEVSVRLRRATGVPEVCRLIGEALVPVIPHDGCRILLTADHDKRLVPAYASRPKKNVGGSLASRTWTWGRGSLPGLLKPGEGSCWGMSRGIRRRATPRATPTGRTRSWLRP